MRSKQSPDVYLAHFNRTDGLGAVVHGKLMARALANYFELTYVDVSLEQIDHEPPDHTKGEHAKAAERFRNLSTTMGHSTGLIREQCPVW